MPKIDAIIGRFADVTKRVFERRHEQTPPGQGGSSDTVAISEEAKRKIIMGRVISGISGDGGKDNGEKK